MLGILEKKGSAHWGMAVILAVMALLLTTSPVAAHASGNGVGEVLFTHVSPPTPPCSEFSGLDLDITQVGPYTDGSVTYEGTSTMSVVNTANYWAGPQGTHGTDSTCATGTAGATVPVSVTVSGSNVDGDTVSCGPAAGTLSRTSSGVTIIATHNCTIMEGISTGTQAMTQTSTGIFQPCFAVGLGPPVRCLYSGTFSATH